MLSYVQEMIEFSNKHPILSIIWIILFIIIIYISTLTWLSNLTEISRNEAIFLINKKNAIIIDTRNKNNYVKEHIANSINLSISDIKNKKLQKLIKFKENPLIIVHDNTIITISYSIKKYFKKIGFKQIYILKDGILGWKSDNLPLISKK